MANNETIADIVEEMRNRAEAARQYDDGIVMLLNTLADRIETVYKRETVEVSTRAATFAINKTNEEWRQKLGNAAKLREAVVYLTQNESTLFEANLTGGELELLHLITNKARAALAAPPRNCEKYATVDKAMYDFGDEALIEEWNALKAGKDRDMLAKELFMFAKWLYAPATEKEGGAK